MRRARALQLTIAVAVAWGGTVARLAAADPDHHWAFQPVRRPAVLSAPRQSVNNPIDSFIAAKLDAAGLALPPPADRATLIRRLKFDLLGLPPTPEEVEGFVGDPSTDAYEKLVERYLA